VRGESSVRGLLICELSSLELSGFGAAVQKHEVTAAKLSFVSSLREVSINLIVKAEGKAPWQNQSGPINFLIRSRDLHSGQLPVPASQLRIPASQLRIAADANSMRQALCKLTTIPCQNSLALGRYFRQLSQNRYFGPIQSFNRRINLILSHAHHTFPSRLRLTVARTLARSLQARPRHV
jgi:hypothetical protein